MATIGQSLLTPESGWKRYDNTDSRITYSGSGWVKYNTATCYNSTESFSRVNNDSFSFKFYGSKLRYIYAVNYGALGDNIEINIDGNKYYVSLRGNPASSLQYQTIIFEKLDLPTKWHSVTMTNKSSVSTDYFGIDALDIDYGGELYNINYNPYKYLIKQNTSYYSISSDNYNAAAHEFTPLVLTGGSTPNLTDFENFGFDDVSTLATQATYGIDTFKPYTKFSNTQIYQSDGTTITTSTIRVNGIKSKKSMTIANGDISKKIAQNIDFFQIIGTTTGSGLIKIAVSNDSGVTWYTTTDNGVTWTNLNLNVPLKDYSTLSATELTNWNTARDTILSSGITYSALNSVNFNTLSGDKVRFAYILSQDVTTDTASVDNLQWQFDALGSMKKLKDSEVDIELLSNAVKVTPLVATDVMKVNVI